MRNNAQPNIHTIVGTSDSTLRTFDTRVKDGVVMEWKLATPLRSVQIIKALQCDPTGTWVAAGFSSGKEHAKCLLFNFFILAIFDETFF